MVLSKTVKIKLWNHNIKRLLNLGYTGNRGDIIEIKIEDLPKGSGANIEVLCDICHKNTMVRYADYNASINKTGSYTCRQCSFKKMHQTNKKKYGAIVPLGNEKIKEKMKQTNLKRYGFESVSQVDKFKEKQINTMYKKYGVKNSMQVAEFREKVSRTLYKNGTQKASKQQLYLHSLYNGKLNYPIKYYDADICFPEEKLVIEYDGSGHGLEIKLNRVSQEEYKNKEITRFYTIKREGYKQMRIISKKDLLPSDDILLQMLSLAKEYFNTTSHSWINFDIDNLIMINAENKDIGGISFNYGKLRKIKS